MFNGSTASAHLRCTNFILCSSNYSAIARNTYCIFILHPSLIPPSSILSSFFIHPSFIFYESLIHPSLFFHLYFIHPYFILQGHPSSILHSSISFSFSFLFFIHSSYHLFFHSKSLSNLILTIEDKLATSISNILF